MRNFILLLAMLFAGSAAGQRKINPTDTLLITGKVKHEIKFTLADLDTFATKDIGDVAISNQLGEIKRTIKNVKGILIKDLLAKVELQADDHKSLNEFYFTLVASDGYKVVFSWNEIYNTETGNTVYLITDKDGQKLSEMDERILMISVKDFKTGRRYVKGLQRIVVERTN
jgi:hypothetical protein